MIKLGPYRLTLKYEFTLSQLLERDVDRLSFEIKQSNWAPGIWAGTEGAQISLMDSEWVIESVNLKDRIVSLVKAPL